MTVRGLVDAPPRSRPAPPLDSVRDVRRRIDVPTAHPPHGGWLRADFRAAQSNAPSVSEPQQEPPIVEAHLMRLGSISRGRELSLQLEGAVRGRVQQAHNSAQGSRREVGSVRLDEAILMMGLI